MIYEQLFFTLWFVLSLDIALKGFLEKRKHRDGDRAYSWMLITAIILSPFVLVLSIIIESFEIFKPEEE